MKKLIMILPVLMLAACSKNEGNQPAPEEKPAAVIEATPAKPKDYLKGMKEACDSNSIRVANYKAPGFEVVIYEGGYYRMKTGINVCTKGTEEDCERMVPQESYERWGKQFEDPVYKGWFNLDGGFSLKVGGEPYRSGRFHINADSSEKIRRPMTEEEAKVFCTQEKNTSISGYKEYRLAGFFSGENFSLALFYKNGILEYRYTYYFRVCVGAPTNCQSSLIARSEEVGEWTLGNEREFDGIVYNQVNLDNGDQIYLTRYGNTVNKSGREIYLHGDFKGAPYLKAEKEEQNGTKN